MAKRLGSQYLFQIGNGASPEVFTSLAGQRQLSFTGDSNFIDTSGKTDGQYGTQAPGRIRRTINVTGILELPDANGLEAARAAANANPLVPVNCRIVDASTSPVGVVLLASMYIGNYSENFNDEAAAEYSFTATLDAAPTTDDITP